MKLNCIQQRRLLNHPNPVQNPLVLLGRGALVVALALFVAIGAGCKSTMPKPSGFLSTYANLVKVDDSTWRYMDKEKLGKCQKFMIGSVVVLVKDFDGAPLTKEEQQAAANRFREDIVKALTGHCELVKEKAPDVAEIRAAITAAYPVGNAFALGVEGEILDLSTGQQLAAVQKFRTGAPQPSGGPPSLDTTTSRRFWDQLSAKATMEQFADQLRNAIETSRQAK